MLRIILLFSLLFVFNCFFFTMGERSYKTGASFFLLSKMTGAAVRFFVVCILLQRFVLDGVGVPFWVTVPMMVMLIWLYTRKGGIKTLVWTDSFQTTCMFAALILIIYHVVAALGMTPSEAITAIAHDSHSRIFVFDDWMSKQNFWKQFLSGVFVVIVMTGLDQDMMQKNLTCKSLREAQKDVCTYGFAFVPANLLFLSLGVLLMMLAQKQGVALPQAPDDLLPMFAASGVMGTLVVVLFTIGIVAASFSSADSALTAITTSLCVDILGKKDDVKLRKRMHLLVAFVFMLFIIAFKAINSTSVIDAIYILCSYTYGPLLGLFAFSLLTKRQVNDRWSPWVCIASPLICFAIDTLTSQYVGYKFGYELLMLNGALTFAGLAHSKKETVKYKQ
jgi:Na+/proline symporter